LPLQVVITDGFGKKVSFCSSSNESGSAPHPAMILMPPVPGKLLRSGIPQTVKMTAGDCVVEYQPYPYNSKVSFLRIEN
jgi:hypothetical protein